MPENSNSSSGESAIQTPSRKSLILPEAADSQTLPSSLIFFISNIKALIPIKLDTSNFLVWKTLIESALKANHLLEFVEGKLPCPDSIVDIEAFREWTAINAHLMSCILATIHHSILPLVKNASSVIDIWKVLLKRFAQFSRSQIHNLQHHLHNLHKGTKSMAEYIEEIQQTLDQLSLTSVIIDDEQLIIMVLEGLSDCSAYDNIASQIRNTPTEICIDQVFNMLKTEEIHVLRAQKLRESSTKSIADTNVAFQVAHTSQTDLQSSSRGRSRGNFRGGFRGNRGYYRGATRFQQNKYPNRNVSSSGNQISGSECQICGKLGHIAKTCWFRFTGSSSGTTSQNQALSVTSDGGNSQQSVDWYLDSGASHHITNSIHNLDINDDYSGGEQVFVGNGSSMSVQNSGKGQNFGSGSSQRT